MMQVNDFQYELPDDLIARYPAQERADSRLLCLDGATAVIEDRRFADIGEFLNPGDLLVFNDTRVIPARLFGVKATGGKVEVLIERILDDHQALAHVRASKGLKPGARLILEDRIEAEVLGRDGALFHLHLAGGQTVLQILHTMGHVPLPPYIDRPAEAIDRERYQTVYARRDGAVAAPTAGLHFDQALLARLAKKGVGQVFVTLHVGAGTFQPVRVDRIEEHVMHAEYVEVGEEVCARVRATREGGGRVVAVGTTSVRSLETAAAGGAMEPFRGDTNLFISPGYRFRVVDALITNFHLPESTLLMLVAAFGGYEPVMAAYRHAVREGYRFYSYGDAMFVTPKAAGVKRTARGEDRRPGAGGYGR